MTATERRGKRLYVTLAALIILHQLTNAGSTLLGDLAEVNWLKSVVQPIAFALGVAFLWWGGTSLRWLVGFGCILHGGLLAVSSFRLLAVLLEVTPPNAYDHFLKLLGYPLGVAGVLGLLYVAAGFLFWYSPSMQAFFRFQREGPLESDPPGQ